MTTRLEDKPVYKTVAVLTRTEKEVIYIANDGREFKNEGDCERHEKRLKIIEDGKNQFFDVELLCKSGNSIFKMSFGLTGDSADYLFYFWNATKDKLLLEKAINYLIAMGCEKPSLSMLDNENFNEGDKIIICTWVEDYHTDYPVYCSGAKRFDDIIKQAEEVYTNIHSSLTR